MILAGIDEAGYGPLLGPLVVSAAAFRTTVQDGDTGVDGPEQLWRQLRGAVLRQGPVRDGKLIIADSKLVHHLADGLAHMERTVLTMVRLLDPSPAQGAGNVRRLLELLELPVEHHPGQPWYIHAPPPLPVFCSHDGLGIAANVARFALAQAQVAPAALWTVVLDEERFNQQVTATRNKAAVLISVTMRHLVRLHERFGPEQLVVVVDKQGGRDRYVPLLLEAFGPVQLKVLREGPRESGYMIHDGDRQTTVIFREKAELTSLPTALASMACKYIRELFMESFNRWWGQRIAGLKPTAGYYQDGQRWLADTQEHWPALGVERAHLVRVR